MGEMVQSGTLLPFLLCHCLSRAYRAGGVSGHRQPAQCPTGSVTAGTSLQFRGSPVYHER